MVTESPADLSPMTVLIVDDSAMSRLLVRRALEQFSNVKIVGMARDGVEAVEKIHRLRPDLVTLDIEMPNRNGLEVLDALRRERPSHDCRVIVVSRLTAKGAKITTEALMAGAFDAIEKPSHRTFEENLRTMTLGLDRSIRAAVIARVAPLSDQSPSGNRAFSTNPSRRRSTAKIEGVVVAISTGGPPALREVLPRFASDFPVPILIVQHMAAGFIEPLANRLDELCPMSVVVGRQGMPVVQGTITIAPGGAHLGIQKNAAGKWAVTLGDGPREHNCRPAADVLFRSAAKSWGPGALGVVMTGMGRDGLAGCKAIRAAGGRVIAQSAPGCTVYGMPKSVIDAQAADVQTPLEAIADRVIGEVDGR